MKKAIIAAGASAVLAAMPVVGVFAAEGDGTMTTTDTVEVTISNSCGLTATGNTSAFSATMENGATKSDFGTTTISITCNDKGGWKLSAIGGDDGTAATGVTTMNAANGGTAIATGTSTTGDSTWAMKVTGNNAVSGFTSFANIPGTLTKVAESNAATSAATLETGYQVHISATQQADTYTGKVTYVLAHPNSN